jgi:hypothetical protein
MNVTRSVSFLFGIAAQYARKSAGRSYGERLIGCIELQSVELARLLPSLSRSDLGVLFCLKRHPGRMSLDL